MYTVATTPGDRVDTADTIPNTLAALAAQLTAQLPDGPVAWNITDPAGTRHRGRGTLNSRHDLLAVFIDELIDDLYTALHRASDSQLLISSKPPDRPAAEGGARSAKG